MSTVIEIGKNNQTVTISNTPTKEEMARIFEAVENDKRVHTHGEYDQPGIEINLVLKDSSGNIQGGINASTVFKVMHLEVLWVAEEFRRHGYGSQLVLGAEKIGYAEGCNTSQTWTFSFQGPAFYPTIGYHQIGIYDGYPDGIAEHAFMKRLGANQHNQNEFGIPDTRGFFITTDVSEDDQNIPHQGLHQHVVANIGDGYKGITIELIIKDQKGELIGGLRA